MWGWQGAARRPLRHGIGRHRTAWHGTRNRPIYIGLRLRLRFTATHAVYGHTRQRRHWVYGRTLSVHLSLFDLVHFRPMNLFWGRCRLASIASVQQQTYSPRKAARSHRLADASDGILPDGLLSKASKLPSKIPERYSQATAKRVQLQRVQPSYSYSQARYQARYQAKQASYQASTASKLPA